MKSGTKQVIYVFIVILFSYNLRFDNELKRIDNPTEIISRIKTKAKSINTFKCNFRLNINDKLSNNDNNQNGIFYFKKENSLKWSFSSNEKKIIIHKNKAKIIENNIVDDYLMEADPYFNLINLIIIDVFSGDILSSKKYKKSYFKNNTTYILQYIPLDNSTSDLIQSIEMSFNKIDHGILKIKVISNSENQTVEFSQRYINVLMDKSTFKY